jgi:hypothetical protein
MTNEINKESWKTLFDLAETYQKLAPWKWMLEMELFGVAHPQSGEIGFCSVSGPPRSAEGLTVYQGISGLESYEHLFDGDSDTPPVSIVYEKNCLLLSFLPFEDLYADERERVREFLPQKSLDEKWPVFRDLAPGWIPWPIQNMDQAIWLKVAIGQSIFIAEKFKEDKDLLDNVGKNQQALLVRRPLNPPFQDEWIDEWMSLADLRQQKPRVNKLYLRSNCNHLTKQAESWLITLFYGPERILGEKKRPYLPLTVLIIRNSTGKILFEQTFQPGNEAMAFQEAFVGASKKCEYLPEKILITESRELRFWRELGQILKINVEFEKDRSLAEKLKNRYLARMEKKS